MSNQRRLLVHLSCELNSSCSAPCSVWFYYSVFYYLLVFIVFLCLLKMINELVILACDRRFKFSTYLHRAHSCTLHTVHTCNSTLAIRIFIFWFALFFYGFPSPLGYPMFNWNFLFICYYTRIGYVFDFSNDSIAVFFTTSRLSWIQKCNFCRWILLFEIYYGLFKTWQSAFNHSLFIEFNLNTLQLFKFNKKCCILLSMNMFFFSMKTFFSNKKYFYIQ